MNKFLVAMFLLTSVFIILLSARAGMGKDLLGVFAVSLIGGGLCMAFLRAEIEKNAEEEKREQYILELEKRLGSNKK